MRLTRRRLLAIEEALTGAMAGAIDGDIPRADFDAALGWTQEQLDKRLPGKKKGSDDVRV